MRTYIVLIAVIWLGSFSHSVAAAAYQVTDSRGQHTLTHIPKRVAAMNWDIAEQVLSLGVTPVAMPNIAGYRAWVKQPDVPQGVEDIGRRAEPNLEKLARLKPDVIIADSTLLELAPTLSKIAPVLFYTTYSVKHENSPKREDSPKRENSPKHENAKAAIENFRLIAQVLGRETLAEQRLTQMNQEIASLKQQLHQAYGHSLPKVAVFRFASPTAIYLYGDNAMPQYALSLLGIAPVLPMPSSQWGVTQKRLRILSQIPATDVALYIRPFEQEARLRKSVMWQALPVVKAGHVHAVEPVWSYGGAMSILYNARALTQALIAVAKAAPTARD